MTSKVWVTLNKRSTLADFTVGNIYIFFTNILEGTAFLLQGLTYNDEVTLNPLLSPPLK